MTRRGVLALPLALAVDAPADKRCSEWQRDGIYFCAIGNLDGTGKVARWVESHDGITWTERQT